MTLAATDRVFNFSAGPGVLPDDVLRQVQEDTWNIAGSGMGIMEHSHRDKLFDRVLAEAFEDCRRVGNIPADYDILFMTGGATTQNFLVPANLLPDGAVADYITTGYWAQKSFEECKVYGKPHEAFSGKANNFTTIPAQAELKFSAAPAYVHYTSNNTIMGTQFHYVPEPPSGVPLVCDMCSDIYSRPFDIRKYGLVYAGAQKNLGPAGVTLVIVRKDLLAREPRKLPSLMQYRLFAKEESRPNTPPVHAIYVVGQVFKWILREGGLAALAVRNTDKAKLIYDVLDSSRFYKGHARPDSRSLMNITFRCPSEELDTRFISEAKKEGMVNIKGHRSTGGMRVSTYNACAVEACRAMAQFMREFERRNG